MSEVNSRDLEQTTEVVIFGQPFVVYGDIENPLFLAADVAAMIEYSPDKVGQMLENVDDDEKLTDTIYRSGQNREVWFLTESGLYELLMQSRKPLAKRFKVEVKCFLRMARLDGLKKRESMVGTDNILRIENARIMYRNFSGEERKNNREGDRNFCVQIDPATAEVLSRDGWNIKTSKPDQDGNFIYFLPVAVKFGDYPPAIYAISKRKKTRFDEFMVGELDAAEFANVDVAINPSHYDVNGKKGIKAYLKTMVATLRSEDFSDKYAEYDDEIPFD